MSAPATPPRASTVAAMPLNPEVDAFAAAAIARMGALGVHLMPLKPGVKAPLAKGWPIAPAYSAEEALAYVRRGGNLGVNLIASRLIVLDAEDALATAAVAAAGFRPTVYPAKSQAPANPNPAKNKRGGSHTWLRVPADLDPAKIRSDRMGLILVNGGKIDVLANARYAVAPPSRLDEAPGYFYAPVAGGLADPSAPLTDIPEAPRWLFDRPEPGQPDAPPSLISLHGILAPETPYERMERSAASEELTAKIDAISWEDWLAGDARLTPTGVYDGRCGCPEYYFNGADNNRSATLHEGCELGHGAHVWSGTMRRILGLAGEHFSRLDIAAALAGPGVGIHDVAARVGIELRSPNGPVSLLDSLDRAADDAEDAGDDTKAARLRAEAAAVRAATPGRVSRLGAASAPVAGVNAFTVAGVGEGGANPFALGSEAGAEHVGASAGAMPAEDAADVQAAARAEADAHMAAADEPELLDAIFNTPLLGEIRRRAAAAQVSPMLALSANINGLLSVVPYRVCLPRLVGKRRAPLNLITVGVDESGGGKGGATTVDIDPVPHGSAGLPDAVTGRVPVPTPETAGSGEAVSGLYSAISKGESGELTSTNHTTSVWLAWPEVTKVLAVRDRKGSTIEAELCQGWSWEQLGSRTKTNPAWTAPASYRMLVTICAQLVTGGGLMADEFTGLLQRIWWVSAAFTIDEANAAPERLAAGRRDASGDWFAEPDDEQPLIRIELPEWPADGVLRVAASVAAEIEAARAAHGRGRKAHPWDRHQLQIRLRLAAAGAILHGEADVSYAWWAWAEHLIEHSGHVRDAVKALRGTAAAQAAATAGQGDAVRAEARSTAQWRRAVEATEKWAAKQLQEHPDSLGWFTEMQAKRAAGPGFRKDNMADILEALRGVGKLTHELVRVPSAGGDIRYNRFVPPKG